MGLFSFNKPPPALRAEQLYNGPRAFGGYQPGAATAGQQYDKFSDQALGQLGQVARTGFTDVDRAAQRQSQQQAAMGEKAQRGAVMQDAAARGQLNAGSTFLAGLVTQQQGANRAQDAATNLQIEGANRRNAATMNMAGLGQQMSAQQMQRASATDQFNQWASGMQAQAAQGVYDSEQARYQQLQDQQGQWWDRITGMAGMMGGG